VYEFHITLMLKLVISFSSRCN